MIKSLFRRKVERPEREKVQLFVKYALFFDKEEDVNYEALDKRAIIEDLNKKGMKLTVTPIFDRELLRHVRENATFFHVEFSLPPEDVTIRTNMVVRWARNELDRFPAVTLVGLEFADLTVEQKVLINRFITQRKRERA